MHSYFDLQKSINNEITFTQEELYGVFYQAQKLVRECVHILVENSTFVQDRCIQIGMEFLSKADRNRSFFRRSIHFVGTEICDTKPDPEFDKSKFCSLCIDLKRAVLDNNKPRQHEIISKMFLSRMIWSSMIDEWVSIAESGIKAMDDMMSEYHSNTFNTLKYAEASNEYHTNLVNLKITSDIPVRGLYNYISIRCRALSRIYDKIFRAYSRSVLKMARDQSSTTDQTIECFQNGSFGLIRAVSSYDPNPNSLFAGQSKWWIRQSMLQRLKEEISLIRLSANVWQHYSKLENFKNKHSSKYANFNDDILSEVSNYSKEQIEMIYQTVQMSQVKSLDSPLTSSDNGMTLKSIVPAEDEGPRFSDGISVLGLDYETRRVFCMHYGLISKLLLESDICRFKIAEERNRQEHSIV